MLVDTPTEYDTTVAGTSSSTVPETSYDTLDEKDSSSEKIIKEQVDIIHIKATAKNSVDEKLKSRMRKFVSRYGAKSTILRLSGDVNYATDLFAFRYTHKCHIIIIYKAHASLALLGCANEKYEYGIITQNLPARRIMRLEPVYLKARNLPPEMPTEVVQRKLEQLLENTGDSVKEINKEFAIIKCTSSSAGRALSRVNEKIIGSKKIDVAIYVKSRANEERTTQQEFFRDQKLSLMKRLW